MTTVETIETIRTDSGDWPVSLIDAKNYLKVDTSADDALITAIIKNASQYGERITGYQFNTSAAYEKLMRVETTESPAIIQTAPNGAVITDFTIERWEGDEFVAVPADDYTLLANNLELKTSSEKFNLKITFTGTRTAAALENYKAPVLKVIGDMYSNREEQIEAGLSAVQLNATRLFLTLQDGSEWM